MMRNPSARLQHNAGDAADGDVGADAGFVDDDKRAIFNVDLAFLHKYQRDAFFHGNRF